MSSHSDLKFVIVGGIKTIIATRTGLAEIMVKDWELQEASGRQTLPKFVFSSNGEGVARYATNDEFKTAIDNADIVHADGQPIVMASKLTDTPLPERICTTDWFHDAAKAASRAGLSFYFLGGKEEENLAAVNEAKRLYPELKIAGRHHGYFSESEEARIIADIQANKTDVLWLALGRPRQERFAYNNREALRGVTWLKTCGGLFKFLGGIDERAPLWMQKAGLEWAFRMAKEPGRLGWRYVWTNIVAVLRLLTATKSV